LKLTTLNLNDILHPLVTYNAMKHENGVQKIEQNQCLFNSTIKLTILLRIASMKYTTRDP